MFLPTTEQGIQVIESASWSGNWAWGIPFIVLTVVIHVAGLDVIRRIVRVHRDQESSLLKVGGATLLICALHAGEAVLWALFYVLLRALPNFRIAVLYSLNAMTSYGHINVDLEPHWHLMGALEALNGWLLFGLTTAFLLSLINRVSEQKTVA